MDFSPSVEHVSRQRVALKSPTAPPDPPATATATATDDPPPIIDANAITDPLVRKDELAQQLQAERVLQAAGRIQLEKELAQDSFPVLLDVTAALPDINSSNSDSPTHDLEGGLLRRRRRNTFTDDELKCIPRLVHRNLPFKQSRQEIAVVNKTLFKSIMLQRILSQDWYHVFLRQPTWLSLGGLLTLWTFFILIWASIYQRVAANNAQPQCRLGTDESPFGFAAAFAFSLETCTTVGYGLPGGTNAFFELECRGLQAAIYFQMIWSMLFNAFLFSFLFARLARCELRGAQVLFSDKAIMEVRDGKWMMHVRIYDFDAPQPVVEAHVRMYCVSWRDYENQAREMAQPHLLHTMRLIIPNDELGAKLFTSIPTNVTHQIDAFSPLAPPKLRKEMKYLNSGGLPLREIDQSTGSRNGVMCPVCGETFGVMDSLRRHVQYQQIVEGNDPSFPIIGSHRDTSLIQPNLFKPFTLNEDQLRKQLMDKEIMVIVEGIERKLNLRLFLCTL